MFFRVVTRGSGRKRIKRYGSVEITKYELRMMPHAEAKRSEQTTLCDTTGSSSAPKWMHIARETLQRVDAAYYAGQIPFAIASAIVERVESRKHMKYPHIDDLEIERVIAHVIGEKLS